MVYECCRHNEKNESAADTSCIGNEYLRFLEEKYDDDHWQRDDYTLNAFDNLSIILQEELCNLAVLSLCQEGFDGEDLHQVVPERDCENRD